MPVTNVKTQVAEIEQTINQEIVFARLCSAFAILALVIACVGLYGTMTYAVARRTNDIGIRVALGARRGTVVWMVLREACVLTALGLAISVPVALGISPLVESFLFNMKPNDPGAMIDGGGDSRDRRAHGWLCARLASVPDQSDDCYSPGLKPPGSGLSGWPLAILLS